MLAAARAAGVGCVVSTSAGRLFDAVSALLGVRRCSTFEGEAATALQYAAQSDLESGMDRPEHPALILRTRADGFVGLDDGDLLLWLVEARLDGCPAETLAYAFHEALADGILAVCEQLRAQRGISVVALSGGCFCNRLLSELTKERLERADFQVLTHRLVPANDGGIALGQAVYAMGQLNRARGGVRQDDE